MEEESLNTTSEPPRGTPSTALLLKNIGVYGFEKVHLVVLASLVTGDPLLLIGKCGTGKTFLLNSLSEAMGLEHRHYNASLIAFDDLVGFPYPTQDFTSVRYLETPSTIWGAESVLVDEISRCKPEHQNRFFSLIHERRIQGLKLEKLVYRWAAMNPCLLDQGTEDSYEGSEPLDQALADRFAFVLEVPDWKELSKTDQKLIADPAGEGAVSDDRGEIRRRVERWRESYCDLLRNPPSAIVEYCRIAATLLGEAGLRISPRRVRQLARNILGVVAVRELQLRDSDFLLALRWSLPHRAWGVTPRGEVIQAAHRSAWETGFASPRDKWLMEFHLQQSLPGKVRLLVGSCPDPDTGTLAVAQLLANESRERAAAFAFAVYPLALKGGLKVGKEGVVDLGRMANEILDLRGEIAWQERLDEQNSQHPDYSRLSKVMTGLEGKRRERATQLFYYLLVNRIAAENPERLEEEFDACIRILAPLARSK